MRASRTRSRLATIYTRLAFPFVWGISLASLIGAILNAERRFGAAAFAPVAVNVVLIATMLLLAATPAMPQETQARWLAFAVSVSGLVHLAIVAIALLRTPLRLALAWPRLTPELRRLLVMSAPAMLASGAAQFIILAATAVASYTPSAVSWLYYAERVFQLPLGFVGSAVGLVLLSDLADRLAAGDHDGLIDGPQPRPRGGAADGDAGRRRASASRRADRAGAVRARRLRTGTTPPAPPERSSGLPPACRWRSPARFCCSRCLPAKSSAPRSSQGFSGSP